LRLVAWRSDARWARIRLEAARFMWKGRQTWGPWDDEPSQRSWRTLVARKARKHRPGWGLIWLHRRQYSLVCSESARNATDSSSEHPCLRRSLFFRQGLKWVGLGRRRLFARVRLRVLIWKIPARNSLTWGFLVVNRAGIAFLQAAPLLLFWPRAAPLLVASWPMVVWIS
jgi:hypothetical protein